MLDTIAIVGMWDIDTGDYSGPYTVQSLGSATVRPRTALKRGLDMFGRGFAPWL